MEMIEGLSIRRYITLAICIAFAAGVLSIFVLSYDPGPPTISLSQNIYGIPLSEMWAIVEEQTGVENTTAVLREFRLVTANDGSIESLHMDFHGDAEGLHRWYRIAVSPVGAMTWDSLTIDTVPAGEHPLVLLSEIERIPYLELIGENRGLIVEVDAQYGDLAYDAGYRPLFALNQGEVVPLERVVFSTNDPWYDIAVFNRTEDSVRGGVHYCTLFTRSDLDRTETVDYREAESSTRVYHPDGLCDQGPITVTLGGLPFSKGGKSASLPDLENFTTAIEDRIQKDYLYPNGSLIGFGYDLDGYLRVSLWNGPPPPENVSSIETMYTVLDTRAGEMGIEDIPVKFTVFISPPEPVLGPRMEP
ncbi:hypothetical protein [Methanoculleus oceani]|uniref:GerMN domain-containing protein n=1 Tax=Methanoculleus oceani TaxID=2184756 RepID=A0ABD4TBE7_9EURY|nr:hypothetical protein [Methanoculleus sp. CWC-02]MCM2464724.1 hypothetical protein [Methanoculleus sp. CWC-02]